MKMVAAARLRRAEQRAQSVKPYADRLQSFLDSFTVDPENIPHPLAEVREEVKRSGLLIITSDKGLCGSYNSNIFRKYEKDWLADRDPESALVFAVGKKARSHFRKRPKIEVKDEYIDLDQTLDYKEIKNISDVVTDAYVSGEIDSLDVVYSQYVNPAVCRPTLEQLLPVQGGEGDEEEKSSSIEDMIIEPSPEELLKILYPKYLYTRIVMALAHSFASEQGQRMVAMTNATDAAKEMVETLTLRYNKARQSAITTEILEVVSGAEALAHKGHAIARGTRTTR